MTMPSFLGQTRRQQQQQQQRSKHNNGIEELRNDSVKARLFLLVACCWPFWMLALFAASAPGLRPDHRIGMASRSRKDGQPNGLQDASSLASSSSLSSQQQQQQHHRFQLRTLLDRVDIMGYGPTHPRVAVVVVGEEKESIVSTVESVFSHTDLNRVFLVCVVVDGAVEDPKLVSDLEKINAGSVPHWHGLRPDIHLTGTNRGEESHGRKIHVMFNEQRRGLTASRRDAVDFIELLKEKHEAAGLKLPQEDLILVLLQGGAQLVDRKWLPPVTSALIVPPPLLGLEDNSVAMKLANAVSFNCEGRGKRTSFDAKLAPVISDAKAKDVNLNSGMSYPTPALNGAALAMRLDTYLNLPAQDDGLMDAWPANLELSLNLWLCADGIDMIQDVDVNIFERTPMVPLEPEMAARFAAAWMEDRFAHRFFQAYSSTITRLEWETLMAKARDSETFPRDLTKKCRSLEWFAQEINDDFAKVLEQVVPEEQQRQQLQQQQLQQLQLQLQQATIQQQPVIVKQQAAGVEITKRQEQPAIITPEKKQDVPKKVDEEDNQEKPVDKEGEEEDEADEVAIPDLRKNDRRKPSKPLCKECLEIIQRASPVDISFVDVSAGHVDFPHKGARDENGNGGYIHDEAALRKNPPEFQWDDDNMKRACMMRDNNYRMLNERVFVDLDYDMQKEQAGAKRDKIFCLIYTTENGHGKIPNIRETWG